MGGEMKRYLFFLNYRGGSTLFQHLLLHKRLDEKDEKNFYFHLASIPPVRCIHKNCGEITRIFEQNRNEENLGVFTHIGNWWGNKHSSLIPSPYGDPSPMKWGPTELINLQQQFPAEWKFINLLRDGRNQIESFRRLKGGVEEKLNCIDPADYFMGHCLGWRNKARIALDCETVLNNYKIFRFEDLMNNPKETLLSLFSFLGRDPNMEFLMEKMLEVKKRKVGTKHSSFKKDSEMHRRWKSWEKWEVQYFKKVANRELLELEYEKDMLW